MRATPTTVATAPKGANFTSSIVPPGTLNVRCDLLNKKEKATIGITTVNVPKTDYPPEHMQVTARQEDLECRPNCCRSLEIDHQNGVLLTEN